MKKVIIALTTIVLIATAAIAITHYYSVKILTASRAYTYFESQYSKGEKDACRHLMSYIYTRDETDYLLFKSDISVPAGGSIARNALLSGSDTRIARIGFLLGGNNRNDLPDLIWFFERFKAVPVFKRAVNTWHDADGLVARLNLLGSQAYESIHNGKPVDREGLILQINTIADDLSIEQQSFSAVLAVTSRMADHYVFIADLLISIIIPGCTALLAFLMLRKIHTSKTIIADQNHALRTLNERINKFVYTLTHDLRSPLSSLSGLIMVLESETDTSKIPEYTLMMKESILKQDNYIKDVLNTIKEDGIAKAELCNLGAIVNDVISQNSFFAGGKKVKFLNDLKIGELKCNVADMKVIFNNLISNAVKYADFSKSEQWIKVKSYLDDKHCVIEIEDNGLGINPEQRGNIFKKYFKSGINKKSMGLGLYFTKQAIEEMNGSITVKSSPGTGTSFIVSLPYNLA